MSNPVELAAAPHHRPTPTTFRQAAGAFPTGVTIVAAMSDHRARGMTANSFTTVSLEPPLVLVCMRHGSDMLTTIEASGGFAISVLAADQADLAMHFASAQRGSDPAQFGSWARTPIGGGPIVPDAVAWFDCTVHSSYDAGDHIVVFGHVHALGHRDGSPLLFNRGSYAVPVPRSA
jgi:flavin reductase (DIM6/NTAB) family NADH-FMN oxidoreductase RutF